MKQKYSKLLEVFHLLINATMSLIAAVGGRLNRPTDLMLG